MPYIPQFIFRIWSISYSPMPSCSSVTELQVQLQCAFVRNFSHAPQKDRLRCAEYWRPWSLWQLWLSCKRSLLWQLEAVLTLLMSPPVVCESTAESHQGNELALTFPAAHWGSREQFFLQAEELTSWWSQGSQRWKKEKAGTCSHLTQRAVANGCILLLLEACFPSTSPCLLLRVWLTILPIYFW